jgi:hypothetical protein
VAGSGNTGFGAAVLSRRAAFRRWRRTCPFWGGFLLLLAGIELLLIPLSGIFIHGAVKLVVYIGIGGVFGMLLGVLLIACGLLLWLNPAHRTFYAIAGVVLYATELSGSLLGIPITLTPGTVVTVLLTLLNSLTPLVPVTMTNVTTDDFLVASDSLQANDLDITSGA